jgi:hypothetical protein
MVAAAAVAQLAQGIVKVIFVNKVQQSPNQAHSLNDELVIYCIDVK